MYSVRSTYCSGCNGPAATRHLIRRQQGPSHDSSESSCISLCSVLWLRAYPTSHLVLFRPVHVDHPRLGWKGEHATPVGRDRLAAACPSHRLDCCECFLSLRRVSLSPPLCMSYTGWISYDVEGWGQQEGKEMAKGRAPCFLSPRAQDLKYRKERGD